MTPTARTGAGTTRAVAPTCEETPCGANLPHEGPALEAVDEVDNGERAIIVMTRDPQKTDENIQGNLKMVQFGPNRFCMGQLDRAPCSPLVPNNHSFAPAAKMRPKVHYLIQRTSTEGPLPQPRG